MSGVRRGVKETETEIGNADEVVELDQPSDPLHSEEEQERSQDLESLVLIAELLEVALHTILRIRQVYPVEFFERRVKFGIPVFQCVDPTIYEYVSEVVRSIGEEIAEGTLGRLTINIHQSDEKTPLEKFIFSFEYQNDGLGVPGGADILPLDVDVVQRYARGMLVKLNSIDAQLLPLESSGDLSFSVVMQLRSETSFRVSEEDLNFDNKTQNGSSKVATGESTSAIEDAELVHIIRTGSLTVYLHVQESEAKGRGTASSVSE